MCFFCFLEGGGKDGSWRGRRVVDGGGELGCSPAAHLHFMQNAGTIMAHYGNHVNRVLENHNIHSDIMKMMKVAKAMTHDEQC